MGIIMERNNNEYERYQKAKKQVEEIKGFYVHLSSYIAVMIVLIFINLKYTPHYLWFFWSLLGWGIGLFIHAALVFKFLTFIGKDWEEKKIKQFMEEEKSKNKYE
jgi:2TM domain